MAFFILVALLSLALPARAEPPDAIDLTRALSTGLARFVEGLDEDQRDEALYAFDDDERLDLRLAPLGLEGLRLDQMTDAQWAELESLLGGVLSPIGLDKLNTIRSLEREVAETEGGLFGFFFDRIRDAKRYFLTIYGDPATERPWALRFDGHHVSLSWTAVPDAPLSATPLFFGAQPRVVPADLERAGLRVLEGEEELAIDLLANLSPAQRATARIPLEAGSGIRRPMSIAGEVELELGAPAVLARSSLDATSRARFDALVEVHLATFAPAIAERYRTQIFEAGPPPAIVFASADAMPQAGRSLYYRIEGGGFLIEFDDTAEAADHIHVVLRNPANDFGRDLLAEHRAAAHPPARSAD